MSTSLIVILAYLFFIVIYLAYSIAGIYHLWRFGYSGDLSKLAILAYSVVSIIIIAVTLTIGFSIIAINNI